MHKVAVLLIAAVQLASCSAMEDSGTRMEAPTPSATFQAGSESLEGPPEASVAPRVSEDDLHSFNSRLGIRIFHPGGWYIYPSEGSETVGSFIVANYDLEQEDGIEDRIGKGHIKIEIFRSNLHWEGFEFSSDWFRENYLHPEIAISAVLQTMVAGEKAIGFEYPLRKQDGEGILLFIVIGDDLYQISVVRGADVPRRQVNEIISTIELGTPE